MTTNPPRRRLGGPLRQENQFSLNQTRKILLISLAFVFLIIVYEGVLFGLQSHRFNFNTQQHQPSVFTMTDNPIFVAADVKEKAKEEKNMMDKTITVIESNTMTNSDHHLNVNKEEEKEKPSEGEVDVLLHEEDDALPVSAAVIVEETKNVHDVLEEEEEEQEEDLEDGDHSTVDENAHDVVIEEVEEDHHTSSNNPHQLTLVNDDDEDHSQGPIQLPEYTREQLEERGFGHVLYAYRVVVPSVAVRTKPSPIGGIVLSNPKRDKIGLLKDSYHNGQVVVGYKLSKIYGLWLKMGPYSWIPIIKRDTMDGPFHAVMKQIRKIKVPENLKKYWQSPKLSCTGLKGETFRDCEEKNMIRDGVLKVMRKMKLMEASMDPDIHPFGVTRVIPVKPEEKETVTNSIERNMKNDEEIVEATMDEKVAEEDKEEDPEEEEELPHSEEEDIVDSDEGCKQFLTWHTCARQEKCIWRHFPNLEYCDLDTDDMENTRSLPEPMQQAEKYDFNFDNMAGKRRKYFVYQPSGGWNNQRLLLESAMIICKLLNRTCIAPPASPHSNYYYNYNKIPSHALLGMSQVLNFEKMNQVVPVVCVPKGRTFLNFIDEAKTKFTFDTIIRDVTRFKPGTIKTWAENDIVRIFGSNHADILYFSNQTMWGTLEWKGSVFGWKERKMVKNSVMPANHLKRIARKMSELIGPYNAVHVRRGDHVFSVNFRQMSHDAGWWAQKISAFRALSNKVYVATDEAQRNYFDVFKSEHHLETIFWESLPGFEEHLQPYLNLFPKRMMMDVLGMIEQLICTYAVMFLGSGYSTFTTFVLRMRKHRELLASDTTFENPKEGLPEVIRNMKSSCDPIKSLTHTKPC